MLLNLKDFNLAISKNLQQLLRNITNFPKKKTISISFISVLNKFSKKSEFNFFKKIVERTNLLQMLKLFYLFFRNLRLCTSNKIISN